MSSPTADRASSAVGRGSRADQFGLAPRPHVARPGRPGACRAQPLGHLVERPAGVVQRGVPGVPAAPGVQQPEHRRAALSAARAIRLAIGIMRSTESWVGLTVMFSRRLAAAVQHDHRTRGVPRAGRSRSAAAPVPPRTATGCLVAEYRARVAQRVLTTELEPRDAKADPVPQRGRPARRRNWRRRRRPTSALALRDTYKKRLKEHLKETKGHKPPT